MLIAHLQINYKASVLPHERSDIWAFVAPPIPHFAALMRATTNGVAERVSDELSIFAVRSRSPMIEIIGRGRRTVIDAVNELKSGNDAWLIVQGTQGGTTDKTNNYEFRMRGTGAENCTG